MVIKDSPKIPAPRVLEKKPGVALALGGGAFHGIAYVGVLKVLIDNFVKVGLRAIMLMAKQLKSTQSAYAGIVIPPDMKEIPYLSGRDNMNAYEAGKRLHKTHYLKSRNY